MMKTIAWMCIAAALVLAQDKQDNQDRKTGSAKAAVKDPAALPTVPEGAKQVGPYLFRYTDPQGKNWMYRQTPFGVSKWEDKPDEQKLSIPDPVQTTVKDLGDSVQFERPTPFGPARWIRKKSELSDEEKALVAKQSSTVESKATPSAKTSEKQ